MSTAEGAVGESLAGEDPAFPINLLIYELKSEDPKLRLNAMQHLKTIAAALGTTRTETELVPYVSEVIDDLEEILLVMADEFGSFLPYVGGADHVACLLGPLEQLCCEEEESVRAAAIRSIGNLAGELSPLAVTSSIVPVIRRLRHGEWASSRSSAAALLPAPYSRVPESARKELMTAILPALIADTEHIVRRSAAVALPKVIACAAAEGDVDLIRSSLVAPVESIAADAQDSLRLLAIDSVIAIVRALCVTPEGVGPAALAMVTTLASDTAWTVRFMVASEMSELLDAVLGGTGTRQSTSESILQHTRAPAQYEPPPVEVAELVGLGADPDMIGAPPPRRMSGPLDADLEELCRARKEREKRQSVRRPGVKRDGASIGQLCGLFASLLCDSEEQVVASAASAIGDVVEVAGIDVGLPSVLPHLSRLAEHSSEFVRESVAGSLTQLATLASPTALSRDIVPLIVDLLSDNQPSDVRLAVVETIHRVGKGCPERVTTHVVPAIAALLRDPKWRIRLSALPHIATVAKSFARAAFEASDMMAVLLSSFSDRVFVIRKRAVKLLPSLAKVYGGDFLVASILPTFVSMAGSTNYILRVSALYGLGTIAKASQTDVARVLPTITGAIDDPIANVRFVACKILATCIGASHVQSLQGKLRALSSDSDPEVQYYATRALAVLI